MKRIIILLAIFAITPQLFAQTTFPGDVYVKGGLNMHSITGSNISATDYMGLGYNVVFGYEKPLGTSENLLYNYEVGLGTRGSWYVKDGVDSKMTDHAIQIAMNIIYRIALAEGQALDFHAGLGTTADMFGKSVTKATAAGQTIKTEVSLGDYGSGFRRSDIVIMPGFTYWFGKFGLDVCWQRGLIAMSQDDDTCASNILFRVAYKF